MKTITEFSGFTLKEAMAKKAALLAEGKTEEEAQTAINEQLKLADETKIAFYKNAVDMTSSRIDRVKRVVVALKGSETEKVPESFAEREGHFYLVEYFPTQESRSAHHHGRDDDRFGRGGRGKGRGGGRDGGRGDRSGGRDGGRGGNDRRPRSDAPRGEFQRRDAGAPRDPNAPAPEKRAPRPPRENGRRNDKPRAPKGPRPQGPKGAGELRLVLKGQSTTLPGSASETPAANS